jgi:ABC-type transport system substrate-binding protein
MVGGIAVSLLVSACPSTKTSVARDTTPRGGTLRVVVPRDTSAFAMTKASPPPLDPQEDAEEITDELFRCCLLRTMFSYRGVTTAEGGRRLEADLAIAQPAISADGLTWTMQVRRGIRYSPPMQNVEVTSGDFVTALRRLARLGDPNVREGFGAIRGFDDYAAGKSDSISGIEVPTPHTLIFHLSKPEGDLGNLMATPATAPIPPATGRSAPYGAADGHDRDGYGSFLVATGPYMFEGSEKLDFTLEAARQPKVPGLVVGSVVHLVRNPSWARNTDALRPAYVDRIDLTVADDTPATATAPTTGAADLVLDPRPSDPGRRGLAAKVREHPELGAVHVADRDFVRFVSMNLAVPPFDDVAVRRAVNYVLDKRTIEEALGGPLQGRPATHVALDSMEQNLLLNYDPYHTSNLAGDLDLAKQQMKRSRYDRDHDGVCDAAACAGIEGLTAANPTFSNAAALIAGDLKRIGLDVHVKALDVSVLFDRIFDPAKRVPLALTLGIGGPPIAAAFFAPVFSRAGIGLLNHSLVGATRAQLRGWGYHVAGVPSVEDRLSQCEGLTGDAQLHCWVSLDQYLMETVVPWAPFSFGTQVVIVSPRVAAFSYDQFADLPALDRIAVRKAA